MFSKLLYLSAVDVPKKQYIDYNKNKLKLPFAIFFNYSKKKMRSIVGICVSAAPTLIFTCNDVSITSWGRPYFYNLRIYIPQYMKLRFNYENIFYKNIFIIFYIVNNLVTKF